MELQSPKGEFIFGMVLAIAVTILAIAPWAAPNSESYLAAPISPIYRPDHRILY